MTVGAGAPPTAFLQALHLTAPNNQGRGDRTRYDQVGGDQTRSGQRRPPAPSPPSARLRWRWRPRPFLNPAPAVSGASVLQEKQRQPRANASTGASGRRGGLTTTRQERRPASDSPESQPNARGRSSNVSPGVSCREWLKNRTPQGALWRRARETKWGRGRAGGGHAAHVRRGPRGSAEGVPAAPLRHCSA